METKFSDSYSGLFCMHYAYGHEDVVFSILKADPGVLKPCKMLRERGQSIW